MLALHLLGRQAGEMEHQGLLIRIIIYRINIFQLNFGGVWGGIVVFCLLYKEEYAYFYGQWS